MIIFAVLHSTVLLTVHIHALNNCVAPNNFLRYHKLKTCHKSKLPMVSWKNVLNVYGCMKFARDKRAMAFNFSPPEARNYTKDYWKNCHVLECPETANSTTLVRDAAFDYYSAYGNFSNIENATCIKSIGLFGLLVDKQNYTDSILGCQMIGADLANVLSESRTNALSTLLRNSIQEWYKAAYVGLDDLQLEGSFETAFGLRLGCTKYRAWAPGHPRSKHRNEDCVILDDDRMWRTVRCNVKLYALCEFYPEKPLSPMEIDIKNVSCSNDDGRSMQNLNNMNTVWMKDGIFSEQKNKCISERKLFEMFMDSPRQDQCALILDGNSAA